MNDHDHDMIMSEIITCEMNVKSYRTFQTCIFNLRKGTLKTCITLISGVETINIQIIKNESVMLEKET